MSYLEKQILGCLLKDNTLIQETRLKGINFKEPHNQRLFNVMYKMSNEGKAVDHVSLLTEVYDFVMELGGIGVVSSIEKVGNVDNFETYENSLIDDYKVRATDLVANEYLSSEEKDRRSLLDKIESIDELGQSDEVDIIDILSELHNEVNTPVSNLVTGIPTGLTQLDEITSGWQPETSIIIGARPSMGKTALMLKFAQAAALNGNIPIIFSLEMSAKSLLRRMTSAHGIISSYQARTPGNMSDLMQKQWIDSIGALSNMNFEIYDESFQTIQYIRSKVRKAQKKHEGKRIVVMIDYLTLLDNAGNFPSDHAKYSDVSRKLKAMAKDYHIPVITLAQLSRGVEQRQDKRPMSSDLRESGSIEQDADVILMLYRDGYYNEGVEDENHLELIVTKQRDGATGKVHVDYNRKTGVMNDWN